MYVTFYPSRARRLKRKQNQHRCVYKGELKLHHARKEKKHIDNKEDPEPCCSALNSETGRKTRNQRNLIPKEEMDCRPQTQYVTRFVPALRLDKFSSNSALYKESSHPLKYPACWEKVDKSFQNCTS